MTWKVIPSTSTKQMLYTDARVVHIPNGQVLSLVGRVIKVQEGGTDKFNDAEHNMLAALVNISSTGVVDVKALADATARLTIEGVKTALASIDVGEVNTDELLDALAERLTK